MSGLLLDSIEGQYGRVEQLPSAPAIRLVRRPRRSSLSG